MALQEQLAEERARRSRLNAALLSLRERVAGEVARLEGEVARLEAERIRLETALTVAAADTAAAVFARDCAAGDAEEERNAAADAVAMARAEAAAARDEAAYARADAASARIEAEAARHDLAMVANPGQTQNATAMLSTTHAPTALPPVSLSALQRLRAVEGVLEVCVGSGGGCGAGAAAALAVASGNALVPDVVARVLSHMAALEARVKTFGAVPPSPVLPDVASVRVSAPDNRTHAPLRAQEELSTDAEAGATKTSAHPNPAIASDAASDLASAVAYGAVLLAENRSLRASVEALKMSAALRSQGGMPTQNGAGAVQSPQPQLAMPAGSLASGSAVTSVAALLELQRTRPRCVRPPLAYNTSAAALATPTAAQSVAQTALRTAAKSLDIQIKPSAKMPPASVDTGVGSPLHVPHKVPSSPLRPSASPSPPPVLRLVAATPSRRGSGVLLPSPVSPPPGERMAALARALSLQRDERRAAEAALAALRVATPRGAARPVEGPTTEAAPRASRRTPPRASPMMAPARELRVTRT